MHGAADEVLPKDYILSSWRSDTCQARKIPHPARRLETLNAKKEHHPKTIPAPNSSSPLRIRRSRRYLATSLARDWGEARMGMAGSSRTHLLDFEPARFPRVH